MLMGYRHHHLNAGEFPTHPQVVACLLKSLVASFYPEFSHNTFCCKAAIWNQIVIPRCVHTHSLSLTHTELTVYLHIFTYRGLKPNGKKRQPSFLQLKGQCKPYAIWNERNLLSLSSCPNYSSRCSNLVELKNRIDTKVTGKPLHPPPLHILPQNHNQVSYSTLQVPRPRFLKDPSLKMFYLKYLSTGAEPALMILEKFFFNIRNARCMMQVSIII